jgi:hypothetical protein
MSITREHAQGSRTTTHTIGLIEGMVGGVTAFGGQPPARSEQGVRWSGDQLVFRKSTTTPNAQQYAHVVEEIEAWSLTTDNVLKLVITHTDSQGGRSELTLTYQKQ